MGITDFFTLILPSFSRGALQETMHGFTGESLVIDLPGIINRFASNDEKGNYMTSYEVGGRIADSIVGYKGLKEAVLVSDQSTIPLPLKEATRKIRVAQRHKDPYAVISGFKHEGAIGEKGEVFKFDPLCVMFNPKHRQLLYSYLQTKFFPDHFSAGMELLFDLDGCERARLVEKKLETCNLFGVSFAEADHAVAYVVQTLIEEKGRSKFVVRSIDSDVVVILLSRFFSMLRTRTIEIVVDRTKGGFVNLNTLADDLAESRIHQHVFVGMCVMAGNDFFHKGFYTHRVGLGKMVDAVVKNGERIRTESVYAMVEDMLSLFRTECKGSSVPENPRCVASNFKLKDDPGGWSEVEDPYELFKETFTYFVSSK